MAVKTTMKRPKKTAKAARSQGLYIPQVDVRKVEITWCSKDGTLRSIDVNLKKADGFLWRYDPDEGVGDVINPPDTPVPHNGAVRVVRGRRQPRRNALPLHVACWWDGSRWVCPAEPA